jgi:hypothetical protein
MDKIDQLIAASAKLHELAKELKESQKYEQCKYHLVLVGSNPQRFAIYRLQDKKDLVWGTYKDVQSYKRLHGIQSTDIYTDPGVSKLIDLIENPPTKEHDEIS